LAFFAKIPRAEWVSLHILLAIPNRFGEKPVTLRNWEAKLPCIRGGEVNCRLTGDRVESVRACVVYLEGGPEI
jgi:hypothetical protein